MLSSTLNRGADQMSRIEKIRAFLRDRNAAGIFIKGLPSIRYFSGFSGEDSLLYIDPSQAVIITDARYSLQAKEESPDFLMIDEGESFWTKLDKINYPDGVLNFDGAGFTFDDYQALSTKLDSRKLMTVDLMPLRTVKEAEEISLLKKAVEISDLAFQGFLAKIGAGMRENQMAALLEYEMRKFGSEKTAFSTIVASGKRSAMPHGLATEKVVEKGDFVTFDFGAVYNGYHSDITRTIVIGKAEQWQKEVYHIVREAQNLGINSIRAGLTGQVLDAIVRSYISEKGYGEYFTHGLGHGVGLQIHELPVASKRGVEKLLPSMVLTIEPGVYIADKGGVRIEDMVVITPSGCDILTQSSKELFEID